jgi:hypothetical protein
MYSIKIGTLLCVLLGIVVNSEGVMLKWDKPATGVPQGYTVYRLQVPGGVCEAIVQPEMELLESIPAVEQPEYVDSNTVVGANYYHVTAYNTGGESLPSNQVCFQFMQKTSAPQNLRIQ